MKKKLELQDLEVKSFVPKENNQIKGGTGCTGGRCTTDCIFKTPMCSCVC